MNIYVSCIEKASITYTNITINCDNLKYILTQYALFLIKNCLHLQSAFRIDGTTGKITVNQILEYNAASVIILTVEVVDLNAVDLTFGKQQKSSGNFLLQYAYKIIIIQV